MCEAQQMMQNYGKHKCMKTMEKQPSRMQKHVLCERPQSL